MPERLTKCQLRVLERLHLTEGRDPSNGRLLSVATAVDYCVPAVVNAIRRLNALGLVATTPGRGAGRPSVHVLARNDARLAALLATADTIGAREPRPRRPAHLPSAAETRAQALAEAAHA